MGQGDQAQLAISRAMQDPNPDDDVCSWKLEMSCILRQDPSRRSPNNATTTRVRVSEWMGGLSGVSRFSWLGLLASAPLTLKAEPHVQKLESGAFLQNPPRALKPRRPTEP